MAAAAARRPRQVAGETGHAVVAVGAVGLRHPRPPGEAAVVGARARHQLGARRFGIEMRPRRHRLLDEADLPFALGVADRALDQSGHLAAVAILAFEAPAPAGSARQIRHKLVSGTRWYSR